MMRKILNILLFCVLTLIIMFIVGTAVNTINTATWVPVEAKIVTTAIEPRGDGGPPDWVLLADFDYSVDDRNYRGSHFKISRHDDLSEIEKEQKLHLLGSYITAYYDEANPARYSQYPDGGREAIAVVAVLFTPLVLAMLFVIMVVLQRRRKAKNAV